WHGPGRRTNGRVVMRVLVVEDYAPLRKAVAQGLKEAGYAVDAAVDGEEGLWYAESGTYDVIVLDLMLPGLDGLTLLKRLRKAGSATHVLILTARDTLDDRVKGLDLGADDYLVKPFAFEELLARVRALIRRKYEAKNPVIRVADLEIDTGCRTVRRAGEPIPLTAHEYALLEFLAMRAGRIVTRTDIWEHVYAFHSSPESNVVDVYIGYLRRKIERAGLPRLIHTRRGQGYVLGESA
ncbi:MAG: response regulator transcription factor, partial [Phycisphaerae bacterium]